MADPLIIDTGMHGLDGITATFLLRDDKTALIESGPKSCVARVLAGLEEAGVDSLDMILVTHIHLDHAGAAGTLLESFPEARVGVHERGARHLIDPSKLWSSASRIYGEAMESMWGGIDPIPEERLVILGDGDIVDLGSSRLRAVDTPGHAGHHHVFFDETTGFAYTGDAVGVRLPEVGAFRPATPPPEWNSEVAVASMEKIRGLSPSRLFLTHFGPQDEGKEPLSPDEAIDAAQAAVRLWEGWVIEAREENGDDKDRIAEAVGANARVALQGTVPADEAARMEQTTSYRMNVSGYLRYLEKKED